MAEAIRILNIMRAQPMIDFFSPGQIIADREDRWSRAGDAKSQRPLLHGEGSGLIKTWQQFFAIWLGNHILHHGRRQFTITAMQGVYKHAELTAKSQSIFKCHLAVYGELRR